jgi:hypothetical protein
MATFEEITRENWEDFVNAPRAVLMLGKTDCPACSAFSEELVAFREQDETWSDVRFGKLLLDQPGLTGFKRASPWLAGVRDLPFTVIYADGEVQKSFLGGGLQKALLTNRLERVFR